MGVVTAPLSMLGGRPGPGEAVALLFPPWWSEARAISAAVSEGQLLRVGVWHNIIVVRPYPGKRIASQAWLHLDPFFPGGCGESS